MDAVFVDGLLDAPNQIAGGDGAQVFARADLTPVPALDGVEFNQPVANKPHRPRIIEQPPRPGAQNQAFALGLQNDRQLTTLVQRGPDILIGRLMGFADAGLFSRGNSLVTLFENALLASVRSVVANGLAAVRRRGCNLDAALLECYSNLSAVAWPFLSLLGLLAHPIILIMFGDQWSASITPARWLCLGALFGTLTHIGTIALTSAGAVRTLFFLQCVNAALTAAAVVVGCFISLDAVAMGVAVSSAVAAGLSLHRIKATFGVSLSAIARATAKSAVVTAATSLPPVLVLAYRGFGDAHLWAPASVAALGGAVAWMVALRSVGHPLWGELLRLMPSRR
jgi:O-antigen/teichoic acid export membrane protein